MAGMTTKLSDDDPDYPAALLANYILGGTFSFPSYYAYPAQGRLEL